MSALVDAGLQEQTRGLSPSPEERLEAVASRAGQSSCLFDLCAAELVRRQRERGSCGQG